MSDQERTINKHAYLIMCHSNFEQLIILLQLLDDSRNDIYIHIDKKALGYSKQEILNSVTESRVFFVDPVKVNWGGDSMITAEIRLLHESSKRKYDYYHFISGVDLPLKRQDEIHCFFQNNPKTNYVSIDNYPESKDNVYLERVKYYYPFQNIIGRNSGIFVGLVTFVQFRLLAIQKKLGIDRTNKTKLIYVKGANWFDITHEAVIYVLGEYKKYKKHFKNTICADEIFLQTILYNSYLKPTIDSDSLRLVDWKRGQPYVFTSEDYEMLIQSQENKLFARKFDINKDEKVIFMIKEYLFQG